MFGFLKRLLFEQRRYPRYLVNNGSVVVVVPSKEGTKVKWKVQVIDISLGGAAFIYEGSPDDLATSGIMNFSEELPEPVAFETVSDRLSSEKSTYRRRGVKFQWKTGYRKRGKHFEWLGAVGKGQLLSFIQDHGIRPE